MRKSLDRSDYKCRKESLPSEDNNDLLVNTQKVVPALQQKIKMWLSALLMSDISVPSVPVKPAIYMTSHPRIHFCISTILLASYSFTGV
jgi:hypothetical protein